MENLTIIELQLHLNGICSIVLYTD